MPESFEWPDLYAKPPDFAAIEAEARERGHKEGLAAGHAEASARAERELAAQKQEMAAALRDLGAQTPRINDAQRHDFGVAIAQFCEQLLCRSLAFEPAWIERIVERLAQQISATERLVVEVAPVNLPILEQANIAGMTVRSSEELSEFAVRLAGPTCEAEFDPLPLLHDAFAQWRPPGDAATSPLVGADPGSAAHARQDPDENLDCGEVVAGSTGVDRTEEGCDE